MPRYMVTAFCEKCSVGHPTGVELEWPEKILPNQSVAEIFDLIGLPTEIVNMSRNYFTCPNTGRMNGEIFYSLKDAQIFPDGPALSFRFRKCSPKQVMQWLTVVGSNSTPVKVDVASEEAGLDESLHSGHAYEEI
jgi:hypothetical protein